MLQKAIKPHLPICQLYRWQLGPKMWSSPITMSFDSIVVTSLRVGFPGESLGSATNGLPSGWLPRGKPRICHKWITFRLASQGKASDPPQMDYLAIDQCRRHGQRKKNMENNEYRKTPLRFMTECVLWLADPAYTLQSHECHVTSVKCHVTHVP